MKVIKKGQPQKGWAKKFTCTGNGNNGGGCKARLLVEEDLFQTHSSHYDGSSETYVTFKCAECGVLTDIEDYPSSRALPSKQAWEKRRAMPQD